MTALQFIRWFCGLWLRDLLVRHKAKVYPEVDFKSNSFQAIRVSDRQFVSLATRVPNRRQLNVSRTIDVQPPTGANAPRIRSSQRVSRSSQRVSGTVLDFRSTDAFDKNANFRRSSGTFKNRRDARIQFVLFGQRINPTVHTRKVNFAHFIFTKSDDRCGFKFFLIDVLPFDLHMLVKLFGCNVVV